MEKILKLYKYVNGVNDTPFPDDANHVVITSFRYDAKRMGGSPVITCTAMSELCLDKLWDYNVYASFNGEMYFIKQIPTSSYDNSDSRYKHEIELVSERVILDNVYVYDVVDSESTQDKPVSNSSNFSFFGDISEFANRLNQSLTYSKVGYRIVVDEGITSEAKMVSFKDQFFSNAIQESYNTYNIPFYFEGKIIHFGYTNNAITKTFKYGQKESLLSIQKQNANYKVVNKVTGVGSEDNIPYYYPNEYESKEEVEASGGVWINPQKNLMPSIYRSSLGRERFYKALNNTYQMPDKDGYYEFENPYVEGKPKEHIVNFDYIKPTIKGIKNSKGLRIDMFKEFAYDSKDNDEIDEEGNYLHPYFFAKLRKFDGNHGFNLFDHSIDEQEMVISMTSGSCGACEFVIGVDDKTQKNLVQVDNNGNLLRDEEGNVRCGRQGMQIETPQDKQNDTINNEVWIALKKDIDTFGVVMPNASSKYRPNTNDTFVILHIDLPKAYILAAEDKLKEEIIKYMSLNNSEKFNFSISFSRIFFAENPDILELLNENARVQVEYDGNTYELYVSSYSYSMNDNDALPEIKVELSDTLTIVQNALQQAVSNIKEDILSNTSSIDVLKVGLRYFLRKDVSDRSRGVISSEGFEAGRFVSGFLGGTGAWIGADGHSEMTSLTLRESLRAPDFIFNRVDVVSGELWNAPAFGTVKDVDTENMIASVRLESNERCGLHVGDFCRGIFADFGGNNNWEGEDECGFMHLYGFWTSYFTPTIILDNEEGLFRFKYELKPGTTQHPTNNMKFAAYGNPNEKSRQASAYATRTYKRYLNNMDTWVIEPDRHIYAQYGDLNGLQIGGVKMQGYGSFQSNAYFRGVQIQLPPEQLESLKGDSAYAAQLTSYMGTVKLDADGNMLGGMFEELNVIADGKNVICRDIEQPQTFRNVTTKNYRLTTTVQAYKGTTPLYYSADVAAKGSFTLALACVGCTASVVNGAIIINSITDTKDCRINITVNCEGMAVYNLEYNVVFVQDGKNGQNVSMYEISPGTNIIKVTSSGVEPSTISFTSWKREGGSRIKFTARWIVFGWKDSKVGQGTILNDTNTWSSSYTYDFTGRIEEGYKYFEVQTDDATFELATSEVVLVKDGENGEFYDIVPNVATISKTMTGSLDPESVTFRLVRGGSDEGLVADWSVYRSNTNEGLDDGFHVGSAKVGITNYPYTFSSQYKYYMIQARLTNDTSKSFRKYITVVSDGENGSSGAMPRYRGEFVFNNESEPYVYDGEYRDIVLYEGNVFQVYKYGDSVTDPPTVPTNSDNDGKWQIANKMRFVAMDTVLVDNANIGGFTFARKKYLNGAPVGVMRSQYGPICISSVDKAVSSGTQVGMTINNLVTKYVTIRKFNDAVYELVPSTLTLVRRKNDDDVYVHDTATVSCSVKTTGTGGSGYTLKYSKDGGLETTGNTVSTSGVASNITFILYINNVEVGRQVIPVLDDGETTMKVVVEKETLCLKVDNEGNVESGLPFRVKAYLYKGANEVSITSLNISTTSGVEAVNELVEIDTESGTLKCTNVDLTGTINAVSGNIGDWNIENGELVVSGIGDFESLRDTSYTNRIDMSGLHLDYGNGGIFADIGINYINFNAENHQYFSAINLRNMQGGSRRSDDMCGIYVSGSDPDIGILVEGCASSHLRSSIGTHIWGLTLKQRIVTSTTAMNPNDDVILFDNTSDIEFTFSGKASVGKVVFMKRGNNSTGSVKLKGSIRTCNSQTGAINTERTLGTWSAMYVKTDVYWTEFYCG